MSSNVIWDAVNELSYLVGDMEKLEYMASAGLRVILSAAKVMKKQGSMKIINVTEPVMEVFTFTVYEEKTSEGKWEFKGTYELVTFEETSDDVIG